MDGDFAAVLSIVITIFIMPILMLLLHDDSDGPDHS